MVNIEIQIGAQAGMFERMHYYAAKLVVDQIGKGEDYAGMPQVIRIAILDHRLIAADGRYHHRFRLCDPDAGMEYPNALEIHTLELPKLPAASDGTELWEWMRFLSSETPEEFAAVKERGPEMAEAVARLAELSADEEMRMLADAREKARRDQIARMRYAREEGKAEGRAEGKAEEKTETARRMLRLKMPLADIARLTDLPVTEVERLAAGEKNRPAQAFHSDKSS